VTPASTRDVVLAYIEAINAGDAEEAATFVTDDFLNEHTSSLGSSLRGRDAYRERLPRFLAQFAGLHYDVEDLVVEDDRAALAYTMTFDWSGDDGTIHPVRIRGVFRFRMHGGRIAHRVDYWDGADFKRQTASQGAT
jgi:steroid delta-isomerase-like uncharacterized protein